MPARLFRSSLHLPSWLAPCCALLCALFCATSRLKAGDLGPRLSAVAAVSEGRFEEAITLLSGIIGDPELQYLTARCLAELGRYDEALAMLPEPLASWPERVRGDSLSLRMQWSAEAGRCAEVADMATKLPGSDPRIARFLARCAFTAGDHGKVRELLAGAKDADGRAMYIRALFALNERATATPLARAFYVKDAGHPDAEAVLTLLHAAEPSFALTAAEQLDRSEALIAARRPEAGLRELDVLPVQRERALEARRQHLRGDALFRTRKRYPEAAKAFAAAAALAGASEAYDAFHAIRATSRAGQDRPAIKRYRAFATKYPKSEYAADALYLAAWLSARQGQQGAREELARFANSELARQNKGLLRDAEWDLGWLAYGQRDHAGAVLWLGRYERDADSDLERARARYWLGRSERQAGKKEPAAEHFLAALQRDRLGYYAQLAVRQLRLLGKQPPAAFEPASSVPVLPDLKPSAAASFYAQLGLHADAARTVEAELPDSDRLSKLALLSLAGDGAKTFSAASPYMDAALKAGPESAARLWAALFPRPYPAVVEAATERNGIESALFYGHMQIESRYRPEVVSGADAIGLMQLLPSTAASVARRLGLPANRRALKQPYINIALGATFLGQLLQQYGGQEPLAIAAYNAGGDRVNEWTKRMGKPELDRWVEEIPVEQTRNYVRRVIGAWARYRALAVPTDPWSVPLPSRVSLTKK